jgi:predicted AlkP superfamily pyrophosphatase or phosphodiesterase
VDEGPFSTHFPRALGGGRAVPDSSFYNAIYGSPFLDTAVGLLAREIVIREDLGSHGQPDFLAVGFSALDMVGHTYGPDSPEYLDTILRLDRELGVLLDFLDARVGREHLVVALSSDHGVLPLPESPAPEGEWGRRFTTEDVTCLQQAGSRLADRLGQGDWLLADGYLNLEAITARGLNPAEVEQVLAEILSSCPAVEKVWTRTELTAAEPSPHPLTSLVAHSYHPERSPDLFLQLKPGVLGWIGRGTSHGSPFPYDTHVPLVLMVPGSASGREDRPIQTVDLAPTLAAVIGLPVPEDLDGRDMSDLLPAFRAKTAE